MSEGQPAILERNLLEIFNERDETKRLAVIRALYTEHAIFFETDAAFQGFEQINRRVTGSLADSTCGGSVSRGRQAK